MAEVIRVKKHVLIDCVVIVNKLNRDACLFKMHLNLKEEKKYSRKHLMIR